MCFLVLKDKLTYGCTLIQMDLYYTFFNKKPIHFDVSNVLSNFCSKCKIVAEQPPDPKWEEKYNEKCVNNFEGSAEAMEVEATVRLWERSLAENKLRYTTAKAQKESISGKGKFTQKKITKIQNYYGQAIKDCRKDVELMKIWIMGIIVHMS